MSEYRKNIDSTGELAAWYDEHYTEMGDGWYTPPEECNKHLDAIGVPFNQDLWLLDVGCGAGHFLAEATKRVSCLGIDVSRVGLHHTTRRAPDAFLEQGSIEDGIQSNTIAIGGFDFIVSIGSLEHIVDLHGALDHIHGLLKPTGKFYFYCPNELWIHMDQPNERTMTDEEWTALFAAHKLYVRSATRWGDNTAFLGDSNE